MPHECPPGHRRDHQCQHFSVLVAEGRPEGAGVQAAAVLAKAGVPVTVVLDSAVGYHMEVADLCVTGAEGVLENGGIINKVRRFGLHLLFSRDFNLKASVSSSFFS